MVSLSTAFDKLCDAALSIVYPQECAACGRADIEARADAPACASCWQSTRVFTGGETLCWKCGALALADLPEDKREDVRCHRCEGESFTVARACGLYEGALRASILNMKREPFVPPHLARLLVEAQRRAPLSSATLVVPVPLHAERERERGFNQAALIARSINERTGLPLDEWSLFRGVHSERHRAGMDARARRESVEDSFKVVRPRLIRDERILLVDDVFTTGATVSACARVLLDAGAHDVFVLTIARA